MRATQQRRRLGGNGANLASATAALGVPVALVTTVPHGPEGEYVHFARSHRCPPEFALRSLVDQSHTCRP